MIKNLKCLQLPLSPNEYEEQTLLRNRLIVFLELIISSVAIPVYMHLMYLMKKNVTKTKQEIQGYKDIKCQVLCTFLERIIFPVFPVHNRLQEVGIPATLAPISRNNQFFQQKTLGCLKYFFSIFTEDPRSLFI